jgi:hypothetical protein
MVWMSLRTDPVKGNLKTESKTKPDVAPTQASKAAVDSVAGTLLAPAKLSGTERAPTWER